MEHSKEKSTVYLALVLTFGGVFGFLYEELFYRLDLGIWVKRGSTYGPWIPIYGLGALLLVLTVNRLLRHPLAVFAAAAAVSGVLEFGAGWLLLYGFGVRLWDYNTEIWNWGNLGGFVCLRSVLFFSVSALALEYVLCPLFSQIAEQCRTPQHKLLALTPAILFVLDIAVYGILHR